MTAPQDASLSKPIDLAKVSEPKDLAATWQKLLATPNNCSRHAVYNQYDSTVRADTVIHPGSDAGVVRLKSDRQNQKGIAISLDCNSRFCAIDAQTGTALSLAESCRNLAATGATPIGISDCLNMPSPENPETMWQIAHSIKGLGEAARAFSIPVVSGNVSLYNQTHGQGIQPTPLLALVGLLEDVSCAVPSQFQRDGDTIFLIGETKSDDLGGSAYLAEIHGIERGKLPSLDYVLEQKTCDTIRALSKKRLLQSCHDLSQGGLAVALAEACFNDYTAPKGAILRLVSRPPRGDVTSGARFIMSCAPEKTEDVRKVITSAGLVISGEGCVGGASITIEDVATLSTADAFQKWFGGLDEIFRD
jgi:phosphoribosylformylglycinamidine synthase